MTQWREDFRDSRISNDQLSQFFNESQDNFSNQFDDFIPKHLLKQAKESDSIKRQFISSALEDNQSEGLVDPIADQKNNKASQIIHRYKNRALLTLTTNCPVNCRYCFRKNELPMGAKAFGNKFQEAIQYLKTHTEINEVILTGGDPLVLSTKKLKDAIIEISKIDHIKYLRFHTRTPMSLPQRVDQELLDFFKDMTHLFTKVILVVHVNHKDEFTPANEQVLKNISSLGISILSQSVLLRNVNDNLEDLKNLFVKISELGITPYYLHHPDQVKGAMHFYLGIEEGRKIFSKLRNELSGWQIPKYVLDTSDGNGKVEITNPESFEFSGRVISKNQELISHIEPNNF